MLTNTCQWCALGIHVCIVSLLKGHVVFCILNKLIKLLLFIFFYIKMVRKLKLPEVLFFNSFQICRRHASNQ